MAAAPTPAPAAGSQRIGAYEVLQELARGGMGTVYLALASGASVGAGGFERLVAIKRMHPHLLAQAEARTRFLEEARVAGHVHHANVVGIHQVGSDGEGHFLVLDYVEGDTLEGLVDRAALRRERVPPPIVLRIALDALAGLHAVHETVDPSGRPLGILHRDVSIQNLLVGRDGVTRLADFGIAKDALSSVVTDQRYIQGRLLYMPREHLRREPVDRRLDVYAMGVTLWIALAGKTPWPEADEAQIVHLATTEGIPPLSSSGLAIAPAIEAIVARACHLDAAARFATARAMLDALEEVGKHTGWIASHAEVAELVERLSGKALAARRTAVATRISRAAEDVAPPDPGAKDGAASSGLGFPARAAVGGAVVAAAIVVTV
jgi:eukaryotic-like serine/threonine-protein kinase